MDGNLSAAMVMDSTDSKIQQLQKAFAELESHRAITLDLKWKQLEEHFHGLQKSLKRRFTELEEQEKEFETKIFESKEVLEKRRAAVLAKEQTSLERLQEKRDAAVSSILSAMGKHEYPDSPVSCVDYEENQVEVEPQVLKEKTSDAPKPKPAEIMNIEVKSYPELVKLCREMNSEGLHKFISENRKDLVTLRDEIPIALKAATDPFSLVLDSLKGFYGGDIQNSDPKKDSNLLGIRRSCIMLMECLSSLFLDVNVDSLSDIISDNAKERAKAIAEEWKPKLDYLDVDASNGNSLEAHAFLQLLATFGINSNFDQDCLSKLIPMVSRRRQTAELCRYLGLSDKMPGVIDVLVKNGRQIDAVNLAFAFELTDQFSPVVLLKSYLSEAKKVISSPKPGNTSPSASPQATQNEVNEKELSALKAVIKCIEDHKIEHQFPVGPLNKQVAQIEKAKAEKKRATEVSKPQPKRPRANAVARVHNEKNNYRIAERYPQQQYIYERPYVYPGPNEHRIPSYVGPQAAYTSFSPGHGNFFGNGYQYQTTYLH
ncbi:FRIGIDA-like protein [Striga asiatica]|uniref:FRIGIDA-like protein n=1 Tax=Striga asiatica TaxID=4170 RepID=A0A5A7RA17_STRAF|nr:FRIGIDA-like protein [Striga asiatica]